eukprot:5102590-Pleurochrysis_carterae.AAC.1
MTARGPGADKWAEMRGSAWWRQAVLDADGGGSGAARPRTGEHKPHMATGPDEERCPGAAPHPRTGGDQTNGRWHATFHGGAESHQRDRGGRVSIAASVALRAEELGLAGPLGEAVADRWQDGDPSAQAARNMATLCVASRARVIEATDARRAATALAWFHDFQSSTERVPSVEPASPGGAAYNLETLVLFLFAEFIRRAGSRQKKERRAVLRADTTSAYVGALPMLRSREARREIAPKQP